MTVNYEDMSFKRLLFKWHGSVWKSVWKELLVWLVIYFTINFTFRFVMPDPMQLQFRTAVYIVSNWTQHFPLKFLLGFFVSYIVGRWWAQLMCIPWPDKFICLLTAYMPGNDHETKVIRRTIVRWALLHQTLVWKEICIKIKKRFPSDEHLLKAGLFTDEEFAMYNNTPSMHGRWFSPVSWIINLLSDLRQEDKISEMALKDLVHEVYAFKSGNAMLTIYDWIDAPLRYTQVTTFATYGYFLICLIGRQTVVRSIDDLAPDGKTVEVDIFFPLITVVEFIVYVGWLKVGEEYRVPFGEDDDDFDMNYMLDRNVYVSNLLVDGLAAQRPKPVVDRYFDDQEPTLPHTGASILVCDHIPNWRLGTYRVPLKASYYLDQKMKEHCVEIPEEISGPNKFWKRKTQDDINIRLGRKDDIMKQHKNKTESKLLKRKPCYITLGRLAPVAEESTSGRVLPLHAHVNGGFVKSSISLDDSGIRSAPIGETTQVEIL